MPNLPQALQSLSHMQPSAVWKHFDEIRKIPRPSTREEKMRAYIVAFAKKLALTYGEDKAGNVVVRKPGSKGKENAPATVLQCHMDMVCEKDAVVAHNFEKDVIQVTQREDYLYAMGTTLGADNGVGMAVALALLENKELVHGPLECLFTTDEETGLNGARGLTNEFLKGRRMINMDSEEDGAIYIGCAGGGGSNLTLPLEWQATPAGSAYIKLQVRGLNGGHSGIDINLGRGNAVELLVRLLDTLGRSFPLCLNTMNGGDKHNAIPREAYALVAVAEKDSDKFCAEAKRLLQGIRDEYGKIEAGLEVVTDKVAKFDKVFTAACQTKMLLMIRALPHGMIAMNPDIVGLVNTSTNLAKVVCNDKECLVHNSTRSSIKEALEAGRMKVEAVGKLAGAKIEHNEAYPGWKPNVSSPLLQTVKAVYSKLYGKEPEVKAIHAGLECGIIGEKMQGMDMISIGPQIEHPHSPQERVQISSVAKFWNVITTVLAKLAE